MSSDPDSEPYSLSRKRKYQADPKNSSKETKSQALLNKNASVSGIKQSTRKAHTGNLKHSIHGVAYQLKLTQISTLKFCNTRKKLGDALKDYKIACELGWAEKFDDIVFEYKEDNKKYLFLVQAKSSQKENEPNIKKETKGTKINCTDLLSSANECTEPFYLGKYLYSYVSIINNDEILKQLTMIRLFAQTGIFNLKMN